MGIGRFPQFSAQRHEVSPQSLPSAPFLTAFPFPSESHHVTQSLQSGTQQQPLAISSLPSVTETEQLPYQQAYSSGLFPVSVQRLTQQQLDSNRLTHYPPPPVKPVEPGFHQLPVADSRRVTDEFPLFHSIATELPHILGNAEDDEVLDRPQTPSFEPPAEREPLWDTMAIQSDLYYNSRDSLANGDFIENASPSYRHAQPNNFNSYCFSSNQMSPPPLTELSCGLISKGRSFSFYRQD